MEKIERRFYEQIKQSGYPRKLDKVLVCVSGGPDSVALLHLLLQTSHPFEFTIGIAHVNHALRGQSSDHDAEYVKSLADQFNLPFHLLTLQNQDWISIPGSGIEEKARNARIQFFTEIAENDSYDLIALGHTQDDLIETILFNLLRGISPEGLCALLPLYKPSSHFFRPLLPFPKTMILAYLAGKKVAYCTDCTNQEHDFSRNKIRNQILPLLREINPKAGAGILKFKHLLGSEISCIRELTNQFLQENTIQKEVGSLNIVKSSFQNLPSSLQRRVIREIRNILVGNNNDFYFSQIISIQQGIMYNKEFCYKDKWMCILCLGDCIVFEKVKSVT